MEKKQYVCEKCGNKTYETGEFQATGGNFAMMFDVQNKRFTTISCRECGYTEVYKAKLSSGMNILDLLIG